MTDPLIDWLTPEALRAELSDAEIALNESGYPSSELADSVIALANQLAQVSNSVSTTALGAEQFQVAFNKAIEEHSRILTEQKKLK